MSEGRAREGRYLVGLHGAREQDAAEITAGSDLDAAAAFAERVAVPAGRTGVLVTDCESGRACVIEIELDRAAA